MKKFIGIILISIMVLILGLSTPKQSVEALSNTTVTLAMSRDGLVPTQDAYLPERYINSLGLNNPSDLDFNNDDILYISDTGNARIISYDVSIDSIVKEIRVLDDDGNNLLQSPTGIQIYQTSEIELLYIADSAAQAIFVVDVTTDELVQLIEKPDTVAYTQSTFNPTKLTVDRSQNIYVVDDGNFGGIVQLSSNGEFLGYYTSNKVEMSASDQLTNFFYDLVGRERSKIFTPYPFTNTFMSKEGALFTTTQGNTSMPIKKHQTSGANMWTTGISKSVSDIYVANNGIIFTSSSENGRIDIYTNSGELIFSFGASATNVDIIGVYNNLSSIAVDSTGAVYTLDSGDSASVGKEYILSYKQTDYSTGIYNGLELFENGEYEKAKVQWEEVLELNQLSTLANNELGKSHFLLEDYELANKHFKLAYNYEFYSNSYWQIRNDWMQDNLALFLGVIMAIVALGYVVKFTDRKYEYLTPVKEGLNKVKEYKVVNDLLFVKQVLRKPLDSFYLIKSGKRGNLRGATIVLAIMFISYMFYISGKGFLFQTPTEYLNLSVIVIGFFAIFSLFVYCNYLVTSISDGESGLGKIYIGVVYSLTPMFISFFIVTILSHFLTYNEMFFISFFTTAGIVWTLSLIFFCIKDIQNYEVSTTIKSILLTLLLMSIAAVVVIFLNTMLENVVNFFTTIFREMVRNVF